MATVLTDGKPTQRNRARGKIPEGLPGSMKSAVCVERSIRDLGAPKCSSSDGVLGNHPPPEELVG